jgi:hypothetical protein
MQLIDDVLARPLILGRAARTAADRIRQHPYVGPGVLE